MRQVDEMFFAALMPKKIQIKIQECLPETMFPETRRC